MRYGAVLLLGFILPFPVFAGIFITEIMYDPKDTDANSGGEWIEVKNTGPDSVDLTEWFFFEADTNHGIIADGAAEVLPDGHAVISRDLTVFKNYFTNFSGPLFRASFSLNDGEALGMKSDKDGAVLDSITYTSEWGAKNDGNSLQKNSSGNWVTDLPTPGGPLLESSPSSQTTQTPNPPENQPASSSSGGGTSSWPVEPQIFADAGKDKVAVVGASVVFEGKAYGLKKEPLDNARYLWNFGDGTMGEGKTVEHTYRYPGDYMVVLDVSSGFFAGSDTLKVHAEPSPLAISSITDGKSFFIEIKNSSNRDIDLGGWILSLGDKKFFIPKNTFIMGGKNLIFGNEATGLAVGVGSIPELLYPNGAPAHRFGDTKQVVVVPIPNVLAAAVQNITKTPPAEKVAGTEESQLATVASAKALPNNYIWPIGVLAIALTAIAGLFFLRRLEMPKDETEKLADEFEIIEDK